MQPSRRAHVDITTTCQSHVSAVRLASARRATVVVAAAAAAPCIARSSHLHCVDVLCRIRDASGVPTRL